jgi:pSer/pThr/pTyr-binding forkhead associated (FHA) protein
VVSLTDGREYIITGRSLVFGREAGCDVVVSGKDVSRRHAEIVQTPKGYLLVDSSTNGTLVNETLVAGQRILVRGDVIRLGEEQFRFYTDLAPATATPPPAAGPPGPAASAPEARPPSPPPARARGAAAPPAGAGERLKHTLHGMESATPAPAPPVAPLANFLVRTGSLKGQRLQVKVPVANIGRADYNDLVLPDPSVSTTHAKLQRREGVWVLVDLESTNGTFVDGDRITGDSPLAPGGLVRFGDVQLVFEPTDDAVGAAKGGGTQVMAGFKTPTTGAPPATPATAPAPATPAVPAPQGARAAAAPPGPAAKPASAPRAQPAAPKAAPKPAAKPTPKPAGKRPAGQQPPEKKGKGCGASAAVFLLGGAALAALLHQLLS